MSTKASTYGVMMLGVAICLGATSQVQATLVLTNAGFDDTGSAGAGVVTVAPWTRVSGNGVIIDEGSVTTPGGATTSPNVAAMNSFSGFETEYSQVLGGLMEANAAYSLGFDLARNTTELTANHDFVVTVTGSVDGTLATGEFSASALTTDWTTLSLLWNSSGLDLSQTVTISFLADQVAGADANQQFLLDTVTLSQTAHAPEPSTFILTLLGIVGLTARRRRRVRS